MKKAAAILTAAAVLLIIGLLLARHLAVGFLTPDFLVQEIEELWNCRAEVDELKVSLLGETSLELNGVRLGDSDEYVEKAVPYRDRPPMDEVEVNADHARIEVDLKDIIKRRISIRELLIKDVTVTTRIRRDGSAKVLRLFKSDDEKEEKQKNVELNSAESRGASQEPAAKLAEISQQLDTKAEEKPNNKEFSAGDMAVSAFANKIEIQNASISATLASGRSIVGLTNFQLQLSEIEVDPDDLLKHNHAAFSFSGDLGVTDARTNTKQIKVSLNGDGELQPFNPVDGKLDPRWVSNVTVKKGSAINTFPMIEKLKELLSGVDTAGVNLDDLHIRGELVSDASTRMAGHSGKLELKKHLALPLPDTAFIFASGSWLDSGSNEHRILGRVVASDELTAKLAGKVDAYLKKKTKNFYSEGLTGLVLQPAMKEGRISFDFVSEGSLGDPEVDILTPFGNLTDLIDQGKDAIKSLKEVGKGLLKGFLEK